MFDLVPLRLFLLFGDFRAQMRYDGMIAGQYAVPCSNPRVQAILDIGNGHLIVFIDDMHGGRFKTQAYRTTGTIKLAVVKPCRRYVFGMGTRSNILCTLVTSIGCLT